MATEFKLPELGENIESADIVNVLVKAGDVIEKEQSIIEIETDKATIEVPSNVSGKVTEVLVKQGDSVKVGQTIIKVDEGGKEQAEGLAIGVHQLIIAQVDTSCSEMHERRGVVLVADVGLGGALGFVSAGAALAVAPLLARTALGELLLNIGCH